MLQSILMGIGPEGRKAPGSSRPNPSLFWFDSLPSMPPNKSLEPTGGAVLVSGSVLGFMLYRVRARGSALRSASSRHVRVSCVSGLITWMAEQFSRQSAVPKRASLSRSSASFTSLATSSLLVSSSRHRIQSLSSMSFISSPSCSAAFAACSVVRPRVVPLDAGE